MSSSILEGNQLIAQFIDLTPNPHDGNKTWSKEVVYSNGDLYGIWEQLNYNSSWNELMPVVEKIEAIKQPNECERFYVSIVGESCIIRDSLKSLDVVSDNVSTSKIEAVFKSVVSFIKWYNQQSKQDAKN